MYPIPAHLLMIITLIVYTNALHNGASCYTPNSERASCVPIYSCQILLNALKNPTKETVAFAQQSQCGYEEQPLVCCGSADKNIKNNQDKNIVTCGLEKSSDRVTHGTITNPEEFPWMTGLEYSFKNGSSDGIKCAGSLISDQYVLTAAHCLVSEDLILKSVWLGDWKLTTDPDCETVAYLEECTDPIVKVSISDFIPHPSFSKSSGLHDIALLRLSKKIKFTNYIRAICLPANDIGNVSQARTVAGWGITENGMTSDVKLKAELPIVNNAQCSKKLRIPVRENQLCAGGSEGKDACRGDSGGPLMRKSSFGNDQSRYQWYLEGIVSWGVDCGRIGYPAIYTNVFKYLDWINRMMKIFH